MKKVPFTALALSILLCACSKNEIEKGELTQTKVINLNISTESWNGASARTGEELPTPVTLLLVPDGGTNVVKKKVVDDGNFSIEIPNGNYGIYAVCGLPGDNIPNDLTTAITVPQAQTGYGLTDFAVGSATISNNYGKLSASSVNITAKRQMAWLTVKISNLPDYLSEIAMYAKGIGETYNMAEGWKTATENQGQFTTCNLIRRAGKNFASVDNICIPCTNKTSGTEFKIVAKTSDNKTLTYRYTSATPLNAGKHLTLNLVISDLVKVSEVISIDNWDEQTEDGTIADPTTE